MRDDLVRRLRDESDLCAIEGAHDTERLLDEAADEIEHLIERLQALVEQQESQR